MIENIIKEIRTALNNELYIIALMGTLTLPDACGKAEFPKEKSNSNRYKNGLKNMLIVEDLVNMNIQLCKVLMLI